MKKKIFYPWVAFVLVFILHALYSIWKVVQISKQWVQIEGVTGLSLYLGRQEYFLGLSYGLAGAFTVYSFLKFQQMRKSGAAGMMGGLTLTGILYFAGCFLVGCCGSPMLAVYLSLFGSSFLGFTKPLIFILTVTSVAVGYFWMERKTKTAKSCCPPDEKRDEAKTTIDKKVMENIQSELQEGMRLAKCRRCGCMKEALENLRSALLSLQSVGAIHESPLLNDIEQWLKLMEPIKYACLGCEYCYPAVATNVFNQAVPEAIQVQSATCGYEVRDQTWPPVPGEYFAFCDGASCPVAVSTLASVELAEELAGKRPKELCIVGKTETENIGIDKIVKNTITNPTIRLLVLAGQDPKGHHSGNTLLALWESGVDQNMRVIGSSGKRPILRNVTSSEVEAFRKQVQVVDMMGCEDTEKIVDKLKELSQKLSPSCSCEERIEESKSIQISTVSVIQAKEHAKAEMDRAGYFVIIPQPQKGIISVEHYSYENKLLRVIEGKDAKSIYRTMLENGWVTQLSHSAYLGEELAKAELSMKMRFRYVQDGA